MPNLKRRHHYIPECYQRGFADRSGKVWVKFAGKQRAEHRSPTSVARVRSLYIRRRTNREDCDFEDFFDRNVEDPFARLSQRIKKEADEFSRISGDELATLAKFVASQTMRTLAHRSCIEEQAGRAVDSNTFLHVMGRKMFTLMDAWLKTRPKFEFFTPLPYVGEQFISGDNPVLVIQITDNHIWTPTMCPVIGIQDLAQILQNPNHAFWIAVSPYVCVSIGGKWTGLPELPPKTMPPEKVSFFNRLVRDQCTIFTLARDKDAL